MGAEKGVLPYEMRLRQRGDFAIREASRFFMGRGDLYQTLQDLIGRLKEARDPFHTQHLG